METDLAFAAAAGLRPPIARWTSMIRDLNLFCSALSMNRRSGGDVAAAGLDDELERRLLETVLEVRLRQAVAVDA